MRATSPDVSAKHLGAIMSQTREFDPARLVLSLPTCPKCGGTMWLVRIEAIDSGQDNRTFECPQCQHEYSELVKYRSRGCSAA